MKVRTFLEVLIAVVLCAGVIGGQLDTHFAVNDATSAVHTLQYNAKRGDCIRDIQGRHDQEARDAEKQFRVNITELITLGRMNGAESLRLLAAMTKAGKVPTENYADEVKAQCVPAVESARH